MLIQRGVYLSGTTRFKTNSDVLLDSLLLFQVSMIIKITKQHQHWQSIHYGIDTEPMMKKANERKHQIK